MMSTRRMSRPGTRTAGARAAKPRLEGLEGRFLMYATSGGRWVHAERITYSFVPDGTNVGGTPSNLFATLDASYPTATWQAQIRRAAAVWQAVSNINLVEVPDDGTSIGADGMQQGDSRFGDIRIGGMAQDAGQLGLSWAPPPFNGGTLASDVFVNTSKSWSGSNSFDIQTLAIHEIGHALGMSHSAVSNASMYYYYMGTDTTLLADDISGIRAIYNTRQPDAYDAVSPGNSNPATASTLPAPDAQGQISIPGLDITTQSDGDHFKIVVPASTTGSMTVRMQATGLSSLSPRLHILNASSRTIGSSIAAATDYGATASVTVIGLVAGETYYIRALPSNSGPSGTGAYGLQVNFGSDIQPPIPPPVTTVPRAPDRLFDFNPFSIGADVKSAGRGRGHKPRGDHDDADLTFGSLSGRGDTLTVGRQRNHHDELEQFAHRRREVTLAWLFVEPDLDDEREGSASRHSDLPAGSSQFD